MKVDESVRYVIAMVLVALVVMMVTVCLYADGVREDGLRRNCQESKGLWRKTNSFDGWCIPSTLAACSDLAKGDR